MKEHQTKNNVKCKAYEYLQGYKLHLLVLLFIVAAGIGISCITPILYGNFFNALERKSPDEFRRNVIPYAVLSLITIVLSFFESIFAEALGNKVDYSHQKRLFGRLLKTEAAALDQLEYGRIATNISSDIQTIVFYIIEIATTVIYIALNFITPMIFIFYLNIEMAIISVLIIPAAVIIYVAFKEKLRKTSEDSKKCDDKYNTILFNSIFNIIPIKAFSLETIITEKFSHVVDRLYKYDKKKSLLNLLSGFMNSSVQLVIEFILMILASHYIFQGEMTIGVLITFTMYSSRLFSSITTVQKIQFNEQPVRVAIDRLEKLVSSKVENYEETPSDFSQLKELVLQNVSFTYPDGEAEILNYMNVEIRGAGYYSIVGENGCGKTTLLKLLLGFYQPTSGEILLNGKKLQSYSVSYIRGHITYIPKKVFILNDTIMENIRLYKDISEQDVLKVCNQVGLQSFIKTLPDGLETELHEDNDILSSGMMQKLSFARAMLSKADIYLVDEITSDLDGNIEKYLNDLLKLLGKSSIVISISHRKSTIVNSDVVYVLENGKILESGTYEDLHRKSKVFKLLFENKVY